ncbi:hypothetical protein GCM10027591_13370 [Zhihengliuella somnathii]
MTIGGRTTPNDGSERVTGLDWATSRSIQVTARDSEGQTRTWRGSGRTNPKRDSSVTISWLNRVPRSAIRTKESSDGGTEQEAYQRDDCWTILIEARDFEPHTLYGYTQTDRMGETRTAHLPLTETDGRGAATVEARYSVSRSEGTPVYVDFEGVKSNVLQ